MGEMGVSSTLRSGVLSSTAAMIELLGQNVIADGVGLGEQKGIYREKCCRGVVKATASRPQNKGNQRLEHMP